MERQHPIAIIGAGPVGLAAAAHLAERQQEAVVLEGGPCVGHSVLDWGHVRLFSPWQYLVDPAARRLLEANGWRTPAPQGLPTGHELVADYLEPLAAVPSIASSLRMEHKVLSVTREGHDRMKDGRRTEAPFALLVDTPSGRRRMLARAVIDASGTWTTMNPMGAEGIRAKGELEHAESIRYGLPDVESLQSTFAGKRVLVVGSGHSAINNVLALTKLGASGTRIAWAVRRPDPSTLWGGGEADELPARGALGAAVHEAIDQGVVHLLKSMSIGEVVRNQHGLDVIDVDGVPRCNVDEIIVSTGARPDLTITRELRLDLDPATEAVKVLGPIIDPNHHSCGSVAPHGVEELSHPNEPGYYVVGMKSYGRAPTFLMLTGYEQVRSVAAEIAGDHEAARKVELVLPETGVCGGGGGEAKAAGACC